MAQQDKKAKIKSMKLTPERTMEVADSLIRRSDIDFRVGKNIREEKKKAGTFVNKYMSDKYVDSVSQDYYIKSGDNLIKANRYRNLALKAMNKNK
jgi:hypothetical protein